MISDYFCIDFLVFNYAKRFKLTLVLLSLLYNNRVFIECILDKPRIESLSFKLKSVLWLEREIWDMFGIFFFNNYDLRRILTDYGFLSFPLKKDFPITGFIELRYNDLHKRIIFNNISLVQEFRNFELVNPWLAN
jgi:NADH:ubiquinone oxidoreductase subunit C